MRPVLRAASLVLLSLQAAASYAIDSYRYLHVSIETPWMIFIFLLVAVFVPFVLMLVLMWRQPMKKAPPPPSDPRRRTAMSSGLRALLIGLLVFLARGPVCLADSAQPGNDEYADTGAIRPPATAGRQSHHRDRRP